MGDVLMLVAIIGLPLLLYLFVSYYYGEWKKLKASVTETTVLEETVESNEDNGEM